ncbi:MAG: Ig-like domain-containing protein [Verrucomicrobiae bacterium]|nr:Ig-like domain-containing protein [Verrucomicrobiae bacterium]
MNANPGGPRTYLWWLVLALSLAGGSLVPPLGAQTFRLSEIRREPGGAVVVAFHAKPTSYYLLQRGESLPSLATPVTLILGTGSSASLRDPAAPLSSAFYRVLEYPIDRPADTDGDGIDDVFELQTDGLDPLNPSDASLPAPGAGGRTWLDLYLELRLPLTTLAESSPFRGEDGVAVTREVILRLTRPLAPSAVVTHDHLHATFGGRRLLARVETAADRRAITLFPLENLPANARIRVTFDPADLRDDLGRRLDPAGTGEPGSLARIDFDTLSITPVGDTGVIGHVFASEPVPDGAGGFRDQPLVNVTVTVDGAEETLRTTTDATGFFRLQPAPAGRFFVRIDGRTATDSAWPNGAYYPVVGKAWDALPGVATNLANGSGVIYLPLIPADALRPVSATEETVVPFPASVVARHPEFAGVEIRVPPNALFANSGQRGGRVGLAPVASDRLPEPLPPGLDHVLDITVQSDGAENFDQPVPVRFPNLPNPRTGDRLPPGAQTALVSFNHDTGRWEVAGSMTVSDDGLFLDSDPGVGIRQPGWHGWQQLTTVNPWFTTSPWWTASPPVPPTPPGPFPPTFPQPVPPDPPEPVPPDEDVDWPPSPPRWPDSGPNTWGDLPPPAPDDPSGPPPDGPPPSGGGGPGPRPDGGGVSAGPFCLTADIESDCTNSETLVPPAATVGIRPDGATRFELRFSELNGVVSAEVRERANHRLAFATQVQPFRPPNSLGFGPAEQAFVHVFRQTSASGASGNEVVQLVTLREGAQSHAPARTLVMGASFLNASSVRFSPHGRYLIYTALKTDGQIALTVVDVATRDTVFNGSFPYFTGIVLVPPSDMVQFGPDCSDRSMVFRFGDTPTSLAWHLINLEARRIVASRRIAPGAFSSWAFTSCGDAVRLNAGAAVDPVTFATLDGRVLTSLALAGPRRTPAAPPVPAVDPSTPRQPRLLYSRGLHFWTLVDMLTGDVVQRGRTGGSGALMEGGLFAPNRPYRLHVLRAADLAVGSADFVSGNVGQSFTAPSPILLADTSPDTDGDGLPDFAEFIAGSNPALPDSNGDGINDAAAVRAGLDPVEGSPLATGIVASVPLPGSAIDVCAIGDRVIVALGSAGIAVLQHLPGRTPTVIALVNTPGNAQRVACHADLVAVAGGSAGLQIVDISDPPAARVRHFLPGLGTIHAVTTAAGLAYAGTQAGHVIAIDLATGTEIDRLALDAPIQDLQFGGDRLYVLSNRRLIPLRQTPDELARSGPPVLSGGTDVANRLFVGGGFAYVTHANGYRVFDLADPDLPVERTTRDDTQIGWSQLVANGSGLGIAAAGLQANLNNEVQLYNLSDPARNDQFLTRYVTPAPAVGVAVHLGSAYVATTTAGLQVLNYLPAETGTNPPSIRLTASFPLDPPTLESGAFASVQAEVADDVQVREVEFYLDGRRVSADGGFPFEHAFFAPLLSEERSSFRLRARAIDTAGNFTWSDELEVALLADATPPRARPGAPAANGFAVSPTAISVLFSEPIDPATITPERLSLRYLGPDRRLGTVDDLAIPGTLAYLAGSLRAELRFPEITVPGRYQAFLAPGVTDASGNAMATGLTWAFEVVIGADSDGDGLTDAYELAAGLDPFNPDENNNGIPDSLDDFDGDGLTNGQEMILGTLPRVTRTFDGILDSQLDRDGDWLTDIQELELGTDWTRWDTDGDGWNDEVELTTGDSPLVPNAYLRGVRTTSSPWHLLRHEGSQHAVSMSHLLRLGDGQVVQASAQAQLMRFAGPNPFGHSIVPGQPPVRLRIFDLAATDLAPNELPRAGAFVIEAEDFNFESGRDEPVASLMPYRGGAYANRTAVPGVDFSGTLAIDSQPYRPLPAAETVRLLDNLTGQFGAERPGWYATLNHRVNGGAPGAWLQFTRRIPPGDYWIWAALSAPGTGPADLRATLDRVTGDPSQPGAATFPLGSFSEAGTAAAGRNRLVLLRQASGTPAVVGIDSPATTFRVHLHAGDLDWFVLIPVASAP